MSNSLVAENLNINKLAKVSKKQFVSFVVMAVFSWLVFVVLAPKNEVTTFRFSDLGQEKIEVEVSVLAYGVITAIFVSACAALAFIDYQKNRSSRFWLNFVCVLVFFSGILTWAAAGKTMPVVGLLSGAVSLSVPIIFGALGGVISERVGVVNIAIEGQLLAGAFLSAVTASVVLHSTDNVTISLIAGVLASMVAGTLVSFILATFSIKYLVDQVIVGVVLNVLILGLTSFMFSRALTKESEFLNNPQRFEEIPIPILSQIPVIGPVLFSQTIIIYLMYLAVIIINFALFYTKWGLRLRSVGEHPKAADTVGINVNRTRFWNVALAGAVAGLGGSFFTLGSVGGFQKDMTAGLGFIALAAVIFGRWNPIRATLAALLFGFAQNLQNVFAIIQSPIPSEFLLMLPYLVTIFAVSGFVGKTSGPAAAGKPYIK